MNKVLFALLAGVTIGVLLAPDKGSATVKKLKDKLDDLTDRAKDQGDEWLGKGKRAYKEGKSALSEAID
jgi:gas vesicle protein